MDFINTCVSLTFYDIMRKKGSYIYKGSFTIFTFIPFPRVIVIPALNLGLNPGTGSALYFCINKHRATEASILANVLPIQFRVPYEKGMYPSAMF